MSVDQAGADNKASLFYNPDLTEQAEEEIEAEEVEETEEPEEGSPEESETYTVKVSGEEVEVTLDQLKDGFAGTAAIQKGLRENATERKALASERQTLVSDGELLLQDDLEFYESDAFKELRSTEPDLYDAIIDRAKGRADRLNKLRESQSPEVDIQDKREELLALIPEWANSKKANEEGALAEKRIKDVGYTDEELQKLTDPRIVALARDAALYRKIMSAKPKAKEVKTKLKSATPGTQEKSDNRSFAQKFYSQSR